MNVDYIDGRRETWKELTAEEAARMASEKIMDPTVERVEVFRNRHERRKAEAIARKQRRRSRAHDTTTG